MAEPSPLETDPRLIAQKRQAQAWIDTHWPEERRRCPVCQSKHSTVGDFVQLTQLIRPGYPVTAELFPMFPYVCLVCGYTMLFNALLAGIVERPPLDPYGNPLPESTGD